MNGLTKEEILTAIDDVQKQFIADKPANEVFDSMLAVLLKSTDSEYGFIGEVLNDGDQDYLKTHAITNIAWNDATRKFYEENAPTGLEFKNLKTLFGKVITDKKPLISNDPYHDERRGGLPEGHPHMGSFLGIPFFYQDEMCGMFGIANRPGGYDENLIRNIEAITNSCANLIMGYRIVREKNEAQQLLENVVDRLTEKNERLNEFTYIVGHDIRKHSSNLSVLANIINSDDEGKEQAFEMMFNSIKHLNETVDCISEIVDIERGTNATKSDVKIHELIDEILKAYEVEATHFKIENLVPEELVLNIERLYINSICENLISNSIKYSRDSESPNIKIEGDVNEGYFELSIRDNGKGIDLDKYGDKLFNMFSTFHGNKDSKGLGLFLVNRYVEAMNGNITVESSINKGSCFLIRIPV